MSRTAISLLLLLHRRRCHRFLSLSSPRFYSSSSSSEPPKHSNLSARLSFVFEQIDAIERERKRSLPQKDETLQRIRAWRESKNAQNAKLSNSHDLEPGIDTKFDENSGISTQSSKLVTKEGGEGEEETEEVEALEVESSSGEPKDVSVESNGSSAVKRMELVHPWPEWVELMERLVQQNYFDHRRKDEDKMIQDLGFKMSDIAEEESFNFTGDHKKIMTACLNFGKDRFDILRSLSRQDIQNLVGYGCPSADKRLVFSAKVLRKHAHLDEGDVCSSCNLRSSCEKAYLLTNKEDEARTVDVMRVLATFGLDYAHGLVGNKSLLKEKSIKTVIRKLLHEIVKLSAVPIDPNLPPPIIKRPPPKVKQLPPTPKKRVGRDDIEMKKGDWLCPKCDFMNFAKNTVCLQCDAKRPKRELLPGEWECPECNFLNYRRNTVCFHCECKRPPDQFMEDRLHERQHDPRMKLERVNRKDVSNAWNFDFDDDESDGADVAAFEYGDSSMTSKDSPFQGHDQGRMYGPEETVRSNRISRINERGYSESDNKMSKMGFDDFDDEEDDVNSYELDTRNDNSVQNVRYFSDIEEKSELEDEDFDNKLNHQHPKLLSSRRPSRPMHQKAAFIGSENENDDFDSDNEASVLPKWKSSHVADYRQVRGRGPKGQSRGLSYGSDEEIELDSDEDGDFDEDFGSRKVKSNKFSGKRDSQKRQRSGLPSGSDSEDMIGSYGSRTGGKKSGRGIDMTGYNSRAESISRGRSGWKDPWDDDFDRSPRVSRGNNRGSRAGIFRDRRMEHQKGSSRNFGGPRTEEFGSRQNGRFSKYGKERESDSDNFRNSRRVIER